MLFRIDLVETYGQVVGIDVNKADQMMKDFIATVIHLIISILIRLKLKGNNSAHLNSRKYSSQSTFRNSQ